MKQKVFFITFDPRGGLLRFLIVFQFKLIAPTIKLIE